MASQPFGEYFLGIIAKNPTDLFLSKCMHQEKTWIYPDLSKCKCKMGEYEATPDDVGEEE